MKEIKSEQEFKDIIASEEPVVVKFFTTLHTGEVVRFMYDYATLISVNI
ncbi:hypothetical protein SAMN05878494_1501 [Bacillus cereus]|nr:hypothetical protein SAMN05878494_1501 [Bacillus cereus]